MRQQGLILSGLSELGYNGSSYRVTYYVDYVVRICVLPCRNVSRHMLLRPRCTLGLSRGGLAVLARSLGRLATTPPPSAYEVLGVARTATPSQIRARYLELAKRSHPDVGGSSESGESSFVRISAAYECLSDPLQRAALDSLERETPTEAPHTRVNSLASIGRLREAVELFLALPVEGGVGEAGVAETARRLFEACTAKPAAHPQAKELWKFLIRYGLADADSSNRYFGYCLRAGHTAEAMAAHRLAEHHGWEQSNLMKATIRQIRTYKEAARSG